MENQIDLELYKTAITRLNVGFSKTGTLIQNNAKFLDYNMRKDEVEYALSRIVPEFEKSYEDLNLFYKNLFKTIENKQAHIDEYKPFLEHVVEVFPNYLNDLNKTIVSVSELKINTDELIINIGKIMKVLEFILILAEKK